MSAFDVRKEEAEITKIVFSVNSISGVCVANHIVKRPHNKGVTIHDDCCRVIVMDKEHAMNLKKALDKAIELGWLK